MINKINIEKYIKDLFGDEALHVNIKKLGEGVQGAGFLIEIEGGEEIKSYVIKGLFSEGLEHDYPADRAGVFLLDLDEFGNLPGHVKALDVLSEMEDGSIKSIGGGREYYLLMERASGEHYFNDLAAMENKERLDRSDIKKINSMTSYLANIHSIKKNSKALHWRKVRDTIGHGECLMGVFDTYPDGTLGFDRMAEIEKKCIDWRARLKPRHKRLCQVHGDFHPGNIWFKNSTDFVLLDRSRGPWGDAAGPYFEALNLFYETYINKTGDKELFEIVAPFYAFRGAVVANPVFYPDVTPESRKKIINFVNAVLNDESFKLDRVHEYVRN
jgi:hypothetical protein